MVYFHGEKQPEKKALDQIDNVNWFPKIVKKEFYP